MATQKRHDCAFWASVRLPFGGKFRSYCIIHLFFCFFSHTFSYLITFFSNTLDITCLQVGSTGDGVLYVFARLLSSLSLK